MFKDHQELGKRDNAQRPPTDWAKGSCSGITKGWVRNSKYSDYNFTFYIKNRSYTSQTTEATMEKILKPLHANRRASLTDAFHIQFST